MTLETLIKEQLDPHLVEVDEGTYYPRTFIQQLFVDGYFGEAALRKNAEVIDIAVLFDNRILFMVPISFFNVFRKCHAATFK